MLIIVTKFSIFKLLGTEPKNVTCNSSGTCSGIKNGVGRLIKFLFLSFQLLFSKKECRSTKIYLTKILGLDTCADTLVGDEMLKGISGGQKKRLTTGMLVLLCSLPPPIQQKYTCLTFADMEDMVGR